MVEHTGASTSSAAPENAPTSIDLSVSVKEEEIDPFTHRPPFTKWDYIKVSMLKQFIASSIHRHTSVCPI